MIKAEPRLSANNEKIERVGHAGFKTLPSPCAKAGKQHLGATPTYEEGASEENQSKRGRPDEELAPFEKKPAERDENCTATNLAGNQCGEMAVSFDPGCDKIGQQLLLLGCPNDPG